MGEKFEKSARKQTDMQTAQTVVAGFWTQPTQKEMATAAAQTRKILGEFVGEYSALKTDMTRKEITAELKKCPFLADAELNFVKIEPKKADVDLPPGESPELKAALKKSGKLLKEKCLNIVQYNFTKVLDEEAAAIYSTVYLEPGEKAYKCLFVNSEGSLEDKKKEIEGIFYEWAYQDALESFKNSTSLPKEARNSAIAAIQKKIETGGRLADIPDEILFPSRNGLIALGKGFLEYEHYRIIAEKTSIPHEAFHYFYENQFAKSGYTGPTVQEVLLACMNQYVRRLDDKVNGYVGKPSFAKNLNLKEVALIGGSLALGQLASRVAEKYDLTKKPDRFVRENLTADQVEKLADSERSEMKRHMFYRTFLTEYLARIYNGIIGNDRNNVKKMLENDYKKQGYAFGPDDDASLRDAYLNPYPEELELIRSMKWNGKSILPPGK
jgi:hypothetical protein